MIFGTIQHSHHEVQAKWDSATTWNREHVWPKSKGWFNEDGAGCDIHHIRPENVSVKRSGYIGYLSIILGIILVIKTGPKFIRIIKDNYL